MSKRVLFVFAVLGLVGLLFTACPRADEQAIVEIAVAGPYSGDLASYGIPTRRAVELVFEDVDNVAVNYQDDQCDPSVAANVASSIIGTPALVVIGHLCSGATISALSVYKQTGIGVISSAATNPQITKGGEYNGLFFRTIAPDDAQGEKQADFLVDSLSVDTVAIIHDKGDYGKGLAEATQQSLEAHGVTVSLFEGITAGAADYSTTVNKIAQADVDAVVFGGYHPEASKLIIQLRRGGVETPFVSGDGIKDKSFLDLARDDSEGVYATGAKDNSFNALNRQARQEHLDAVWGRARCIFL